MPRSGEIRLGVIGVGNTLVSDDGVGIRVVRTFRGKRVDERVALIESERGGMDLLDRLEGFDYVMIVDAALTGLKAPGEVVVLTIAAPFAVGESRSLHTIDLRGLLAFGEAAGMAMPSEVTVLSIEAGDIETFHEGCTEKVEQAIPGAVAVLEEEVRRILAHPRAVSRCSDSAIVEQVSQKAI
jgi:hydrogenase maturation protease